LNVFYGYSFAAEIVGFVGGVAEKKHVGRRRFKFSFLCTD
jgi:hypothetical protein